MICDVVDVTKSQFRSSCSATKRFRFHVFKFFWEPAAGDEISDKTRTTICGVSDKITKLLQNKNNQYTCPPAPNSIQYPLHSTLTHTRAENSTTCVPHKYTQRAKPNRAWCDDTIQYSTVQLYCTADCWLLCCMLCLMSRFICVFNSQACSLFGAGISLRNSSILGVHNRPACRTSSVLYAATVQLERQLF